jgi:lipoprotein-anchoring transpeptidase ErfK/SrfK
MKHGLPGRAGRRDAASSVAPIALLLALPPSLPRTRPSHPVSAWSFHQALGCRPPERALLEELPAGGADDPLDLVGHAAALANRVGRHPAVAMGSRLSAHMVLDDNCTMKLVSVVLLVAASFAVLSTSAVAARLAKPHCRGGVLHPVGSPTSAFAAIVKSRAQVYRKSGHQPLAHFRKLNQNGYPTTFSIVGAIVNRTCGASWYRVKLPMRPNGVVGYVRPADVLVERVTTRIVVDLSTRRLAFYRHGKLVLTTPVAVGAPSTPTPVGRFYVNQRLVTTNAGGPFGPAALGVSAFSDVLTGWTQGGPIGIHGTNQPWSIGRAVSNGCIRVPNATLTKIFDATLGGSPVVIHA